MERKLHQEPVFDLNILREKVDLWKGHGVSHVLIEWSTGVGPSLYYYPEGQRRYGVKWTAAVETYNYNEVYADYLEHRLLPRLIEAVQARGLTPVVRCVDLQPLQVQRQRRRQLEKLQHSSAAHH